MAGNSVATITAAEIREAERKKRSNIDRIILQNARKSYDEIAELTGTTPALAAERLEDLLRAHDHLTDRQEERLLIIEMGDLIDEVRSRMSSSKDENFADIANVALRGYEAISKRLDARRKLTEADIAEITRAQGEVFLAILTELMNFVGTRMEEAFPDADDVRGQVEEAFADGFPIARSAVYDRVRQ